MKKLLGFVLLVFTLGIFAPVTEAAPNTGTVKMVKVVKVHKKHRKYHKRRDHHRHHHRVVIIIRRLY